MNKKLITLLVLLTVAIFLSGCVKEKSDKKIKEVILEEDQKETAVSTVTEEKDLKSPLKALLEANLINYDNASDIYPSDTVLHFRYNSREEKLKVFISSDGIPDDVIKKEEYQANLARQEDGNWQVTDKRLIKEECWPGRSCK
jgi:hypothetical protein